MDNLVLENGEPRGSSDRTAAYVEHSADGVSTIYGPDGNVLMIVATRSVEAILRVMRGEW